MTISVRQGGDPDGPRLLLLHGLGGTGRVWDGVVERLDDQWSWIAPDLPGHGASPPPSGYSFGALADAVARGIERDRPVAVLGHSLGGGVGLALASGWFGVTVPAVCGLGIKVRWTEDDLARARAVAGKPPRAFDTHADAVERALKVAGLDRLVAADSPAAMSAVTVVDGRWHLATDPAAFAVGAPDMPGLLAAARAEVILAAGEHDQMGPPEHLRELVEAPVQLDGLGHNAHVEDPKALDPLLDRLLKAVS